MCVQTVGRAGDPVEMRVEAAHRDRVHGRPIEVGHTRVVVVHVRVQHVVRGRRRLALINAPIRSTAIAGFGGATQYRMQKGCITTFRPR
jgi:hypothetical protein